MQRHLAAVLVADIVGYSRLMGEDEVQMLAALVHLRDTLFEPVVKERAGDIIKRMGDGWLIEYANVSDAVACAIEIQQGLSGHEFIKLRIGIHVGDITRMDQDVYGDGVNIAARLESLAEPGQVLISDTAYNSLDGKTARQFGGGKGCQLKNIARTVQIWHWPEGHEPASYSVPINEEQDQPQEKPSIAVLSFNNMSGDAEQEFFSDGITEDIITDLSKASGLLVIARNSSFFYKNKAMDVRQICRELDVKYVLEGSVRKAGSQVRINAQLIDGLTGGHVWADRFDRSLEDIFAVQDEITREIVEALKVALTPKEKTERKKRGKVDPIAYECWIRGRALIYEFNRDSMPKAREMFERAIALDTGLSARALAGLSMICSTEFFNSWNDAGPDTLKQALELAKKAITENDKAPFGFHALAIALLWSGDAEGAAIAAEQAMELDSNFAGPVTLLGITKELNGQHLEAIEFFQRSLRLDPKYDVTHQTIGRTLLGLGRYEEAEIHFMKKLSMAPQSDYTRLFLAALYGLTDRIEDAHLMWREIKEINPDFSLDHYKKVIIDKKVHWYPVLMEGLQKAGLPD